MLSYQEALDFLNNLLNYEKVPMPPPSAGAFNLERVRLFLEKLGQPQHRYPSLMIAGTKGKGSTAILIASALQAAGYRVGLYTQPHLHSYRERMRVNDTMISREELAALVTELRPVVETMLAAPTEWGAITTYEVGTGLALLYFARQEVGIAVLEVGMGGRLDAVNVVEPLVSVIASLSLDHMAVLGDTIEQIAFEKAGIIKPGVPIVTAPQPPTALAVLEKVSRERGAPLEVIEPAQLLAPTQPLDPLHRRHLSQQVALNFGPHTVETSLLLLGEHQRVNAALAAAALWQQQELPGGLPVMIDNLKTGFSNTSWPVRLQVLSDTPGQPLIVADGAHNADSAARLRQAIIENFYFENLWLVVGIYRDKDIAGIFEALNAAPLPAGLVLTRSRSPRAVEPAMLAAQAQEHNFARLETSEGIAESIEKARQLAGPLDLICITGSLSVAAEAQELFQSYPLTKAGEFTG